MNVQAGQVVEQLGVRIVEVVRFKVSQGDEDRRCDDRALEKILIIELLQSINNWLDVSERLLFESDF
jgi:hypothetical protein